MTTKSDKNWNDPEKASGEAGAPAARDPLTLDDPDGDDDDLENLLTVNEAAKLLRLKRSTLDHYRCQGRGPVYRKHGGRILYSRASLDRWSRRARFRATGDRIGRRR